MAVTFFGGLNGKLIESTSKKSLYQIDDCLVVAYHLKDTVVGDLTHVTIFNKYGKCLDRRSKLVRHIFNYYKNFKEGRITFDTKYKDKSIITIKVEGGE